MSGSNRPQRDLSMSSDLFGSDGEEFNPESLLKSIEIIKEEQRIRKATATANATASSLASAENIQRNNEIEAIKQRIQPYNELTDRKSAIIRSSMKETPVNYKRRSARKRLSFEPNTKAPQLINPNPESLFSHSSPSSSSIKSISPKEYSKIRPRMQIDNFRCGVFWKRAGMTSSLNYLKQSKDPKFCWEISSEESDEIIHINVVKRIDPRDQQPSAENNHQFRSKEVQPFTNQKEDSEIDRITIHDCEDNNMETLEASLKTRIATIDSQDYNETVMNFSPNFKEAIQEEKNEETADIKEKLKKRTVKRKRKDKDKEKECNKSSVEKPSDENINPQPSATNLNENIQEKEVIDLGSRELEFQDSANWIEQFDKISAASVRNGINHFKREIFNQIMESSIDYKDLSKRILQLILSTEICNKTIYPYWQSIFHYKEWNDELESKKVQRRNSLKQRILDALKWMKSCTLYEYTKPEDLKKKLENLFPFCDYENTKEHILLAKGKYNSMYIVVDSMCRTVRIEVKK